MTVDYSFWWALGRLLFRWRGSVHKAVWGDLLVFGFLYFCISCLYRFYLDDPSKRTFEHIVIESAKYRDRIPVSLLLGFYALLVVIRWFGICLAFPDNTNTAILLATHIPGNEKRAFEIRSRIVRYIKMSLAMVFSRISPVVRKCFPDVSSLAVESIATQMEGAVLKEASGYEEGSVAWVPLTWCCHLVQIARDEGFLQTDAGKKALLREINALRRQCGVLLKWNRHNVPLIYTQVVALAVYSYFLVSLLSEQFLDEKLHYENYRVDYVVPVSAVFQLVFYLGWLKLAASLLNPFGKGDHSVDLLNVLESARDSAFVISHMDNDQYSPDAQWLPRQEDRLRIVDLGSLGAWRRLEALSLEESYPKANKEAAFIASLTSDVITEVPSASTGLL